MSLLFSIQLYFVSTLSNPYTIVHHLLLQLSLSHMITVYSLLQNIVPINQGSGRSGQRNFSSSYQGSLFSFIDDTFEMTIVVLFPALSSLLTFRCR